MRKETSRRDEYLMLAILISVLLVVLFSIKNRFNYDTPLNIHEARSIFYHGKNCLLFQFLIRINYFLI